MCMKKDNDLIEICSLTSDSMRKQFGIELESEKYADIFEHTLRAILEYLKKKQKELINEYDITLFKSISIGYTNNCSLENETLGCFQVFMEFHEINKTIQGQEKSILKNLSNWKYLNISSEIENEIAYYKELEEIEKNAYDQIIDNCGTILPFSEMVFVAFCTFMDCIVSFLKEKYKQTNKKENISEVSTNILNFITAYYTKDEEDDIIHFMPCNIVKKELKNDELAQKAAEAFFDKQR